MMAPLSDESTTGAPALSIVLTGRNDDHGADFKARFFRTLRFNARQLSARGIPHEFVFVEWAPPADRPRLVDLVFDAIPDLDPAALAWYVVDAEYHHAFSLNPRLQYQEFIAKNVGIRRARGRVVLATNCDVYLGRQVLDALERDRFEPGIVYRAARYDLKERCDENGPKWSELEDPENLDGPARRLKPPLMAGGTGDFVLLDRETFHRLRGFNEVYRVARIGVDRNFITKALSSGLRLEDIGGPVYHVNHAGSFHLASGVYAGREAEAPWGDRRWHSGGVVYDNPPTWGLAKAPVRREAERCWCVDFSWDAVPPLVDLKRVVLPVARLGRPYPGRYVTKVKPEPAINPTKK